MMSFVILSSTKSILEQLFIIKLSLFSLLYIILNISVVFKILYYSFLNFCVLSREIFGKTAYYKHGKGDNWSSFYIKNINNLVIPWCYYCLALSKIKIVLWSNFVNISRLKKFQYFLLIIFISFQTQIEANRSYIYYFKYNSKFSLNFLNMI